MSNEPRKASNNNWIFIGSEEVPGTEKRALLFSLPIPMVVTYIVLLLGAVHALFYASTILFPGCYPEGTVVPV